MNENKSKDKYLFAIDLDGTLLKDSAKNEVNNIDKKAIKKLIDHGHIVCIITGRPWRASKKTYNELNLKSVIGNNNGAHIHNPEDYNFNPYISYLNLNDVMYILGDKEISKISANVAIEGPGWVMLEKREENLEKVFGFSKAPTFKLGIDIHRLPLKPTGVVFDTKPGVNVLKLHDYLQRTYGDLVEFSSWSKGEGLTPVFDMTAVGVTKAKSLSLMARYYKIPMKNTIAIGDGYNDMPMFEAAEISVAVGNASQDIKEQVTFVCKNTNKTGAIAEFVKAFLERDDSFIKKQRIKRRRIRKIKDLTVGISE